MRMEKTFVGYKFIGNTDNRENTIQEFVRMGVAIHLENPAYDINGKKLPDNYWGIYVIESCLDKYREHMEARLEDIKRGKIKA